MSDGAAIIVVLIVYVIVLGMLSPTLGTLADHSEADTERREKVVRTIACKRPTEEGHSHG